MLFRIVNTPFSTSKAKDILDSVIGQLSDGIWENSPAMDKYWKFVDINDNIGEIVIIISGDSGKTSPSWRPGHLRYTPNGFYEMGDDQVCSFFAKKLKAIIKEEGLEWKRDNEEISDYVGYDTPISVKEIYAVYDALLGRKNRCGMTI